MAGSDGAFELSDQLFEGKAGIAKALLCEIAGVKKPAEATPFWRIVEPASPLAKTLSCGPDFVARMRAVEAGGM